MIFKFLQVILLASVKYMLTLPYAMIIGMEYKYAILAVLGGGIGGFLFFYYLSKPLNRGWDMLRPALCRLVPISLKQRIGLVFCQAREHQLKKRNFSKRNRFFVKVKTTYGFWGIIVATPFFLTIPIGAFLVNRYYSRRKYIVMYMILSIVGWGAVYSGIIHLFPKVFF